MARSRNWCFTAISEHDHLIRLWDQELQRKDFKYLIFGRERCPTTGRMHLQGYVEFENAKTLNGVKAALECGNGIHLEKRRGTVTQAIEYCKKDGDFFEKGDPSMEPAAGGQLEKDRWTRARRNAEEGKYDEIDDEIYIKHFSAIKKIRSEAIQKPETLNGHFVNEWLYGPSGSGKSQTARIENPGAYDKDPKERWWDGYNGEDVVIIDDFDKYQKAQGGDIKRWADRYPFPAAIKGGYMQIRPKKIVVTSQYHPNQIWDDQETLDAITRRFTFRSFGEAPVPAPYHPMFTPYVNRGLI